MWQSRNVKATKQHTRIDVHPATRFFALNKECGTFIIPYSLFRENFWGFFKTLFLPPWRHISVWSSIWLEVIMFFERSRFFRDNDMSALVLILRKEQYCMFVLYIRMFVGDRLNIIVTSVNIPSKCSYLILLHSWSRVSKIFEWVACYQEKSVLFVAVVVVVFSAGVPLLTSAGSNSGSNCVIGLARNLP